MRRALSRLFRREDGTATVEFVLVVPVVISIFMASVEAGFYMAKHVMLERGLDLVMRDIRLGNLGTFENNKLRKLICEATPILVDCENTLMVEMRPISTSTFAISADPATCVDRGESTEVDDHVEPGGSNEIMIIRVCAIQDPIFPSTGIGLHLRADARGGYQMVTASVFVNEPR
ncbi:pilus assembly protein [Rhodobacter sp. SGA-6-6]|nr:pilus assembly protein [Rhodobacter sp. SGA-6-6]